MKIVKVEDMHADGGWRTLSYMKITTDEGLSAGLSAARVWPDPA